MSTVISPEIFFNASSCGNRPIPIQQLKLMDAYRLTGLKSFINEPVLPGDTYQPAKIQGQRYAKVQGP